MTRWIAALLVVAAAFIFVAAQDEGEKPVRFPFGSSKSQLPFDVIDQDGKKAWRVTGRGNVRVEELVAGYTTATGKRIVYDASVGGGSKHTVQYVGPDDGMVIPNDELGNYVSELLESVELTLVGHSTAKARVVSMRNVHGYAQVIQPAELANLPETEWVTLSWDDIGEARSFSQLVRHFESAQVRMLGDDTVLTATGRVAQLRNINALVAGRAATGSNGMQIRTYNLPATVKATDAQRVMNELFAVPSTTVVQTGGTYQVTTQARHTVHVSIVSGANRLLVRASPADHELVQAAITAMQ